jgi:lipopolysaccharide export LptBFGC system permease protein LptF
MTRTGWIISKYLLQAVLPYFGFSWLLLSVILFVQQASRFSDVFLTANLPANLIWQLTFALVPNVISFTCPMAIIVGTVIGLAKMQTDSELMAMRAAGVGNLQITIPIAVLGVVLSLFSLFINIKGVPFAAALVRRVALETAIKKLESPIEPGIFNSEVAGFTIFVRNGDAENGHWRNIFIFKEDGAAGVVRLITADEGRIDFSDQDSELVLENAVVSTLPTVAGSGNYVSENLGQIRFAIKTRRAELIQKLTSTGGSIEELGLSQLSDYSSSAIGRDQIEAQILWYRRVLLSITPLLFSLLGSAMVLRFSRGGRGMGILLALMGLIGYYLLAFAGEQLARTGFGTPFTGSLLPVLTSIAVIIWFNLKSRAGNRGRKLPGVGSIVDRFRRAPNKIQLRNLFVDVTTGIRDFEITLNLIRYFLLALGFLGSIFLIFTAFDLWKYAGTMAGGSLLLVRYLIYLSPFLYIQLVPAAAMIATLATYMIKSRQNEIVTWTSAGQSVYRLLLPCCLASLALGIISWQIQERVLPSANEKQEVLRTLIVGRGSPGDYVGRHWVAGADRIYSFHPDDIFGSQAGLAGTAASDNEKQTSCSGCVRNVSVFGFDRGAALQSVYRSSSAKWENGNVELNGGVEEIHLDQGGLNKRAFNEYLYLGEPADPFVRSRTSPNYLNISGIKRQLAEVESDAERRRFSIALEKRYATIAMPFVVILFSAPFAFSLGRKAKAAKVGFAVALWLLFTATSSLFEQLGLAGYLAAWIAVWAPLMAFAVLGTYRISRIPT